MAGTQRNVPAACCCDPCSPLDSFSSEVEVASADVTTIRSKQHPQSPYPTWLTVGVKVSSGAVARIFVLWDDGTPGDGIYIAFEPDTPTATSGTVTVYRKDGTQIGYPWFVLGAVSDEYHAFTICYDPDTDPEEMAITVDPAGSYPAQSMNILLPSGMTIGRKSGYGTGSGTGSVWFQDYSFERLWYCGNGTEDCHELEDDWDYTNTLPTRTYCRPCTRCPAGPRQGVAGDWTVVAGTWLWPAQTTSTDARLVAIAGQSDWQMCGQGIIPSLVAGDEAIFGWSDAISRNQVYVKVTISSGTHTVAGGTYYDERDSRFYFWFTGLGTFDITYTVYRVTDGAAPSVVSGPTTLTSGDTGGGVIGVLGDGYTTLHAHMRHAMLGTGDNSTAGIVRFAGFYNQCDCGGYLGGSSTLRPPRKYTATVAGVTQGDWNLGGGTYFPYGLLNRSVTLRNYFHNSPGSPYTAPCPNCCHSNYVITGSDIQNTWFYGTYVNNYTELHGYAYASWMSPVGAVVCEVHFRKLIYGVQDLRDLVGEVLDYYEMIPSPLGPPYKWLVDPQNATFTITSVV